MGIVSVILAAVAGFVVGAVWYMILATPWMDAAGIARGPDGKPLDRSALPFVLAFIAMLLVAGMMRHIFALSGISTAGAGVVSGLGIGLFFIAPWIMINNAYSQRPMRLTLIDGGYAVVGCMAIGAVLTLV